MPAQLPELLAYGHHSGGGAVGSLLSLLATAALWSFVSRVIHRAPLALVVPVVLFAAAWWLWSRRGGRRARSGGRYRRFGR